MSIVDSGGSVPALPYRVLARKYRPASFADLIGQDAMVRTLSNAFDSGRIHQAYLLSGVRGVGKTTTARIVARALNYHRPARDALPLIDRPTILMDELGTHCQAIIESRHVDVIEMDAASHTGIDDIRELIEGARYRPVMARAKVYIIDEVHMLSKAAFNGLLKTLEEPPEHVKFLFATTEVDKVPVTVRSRCQRFDLRRVEAPALVAHLASICAREGMDVSADALSIIARAAEGSVRDSLSLLDQALASGSGGSIGGDDIRAMLGLADRARVIDLFEQVMRGDIAGALTGMKALHDGGADPLSVVTDLADFVHLVTRLKLVPDAAKDPALTGEERTRGQAFATGLGLPVLTRTWQMLLKGLGDIKDSPRPLAAAEMVLVRLAYAADLPTPDEAIRQLGSRPEGRLPTPASAAPSGPAPVVARLASGAGASALAAAPRPVPSAPPRPAAPELPRMRSFADVVALAGAKRDIQLKTALERDVRLVRFEEGSIEFELAPDGAPTLAATLMRKLGEWTGQRWMVAVTAAGGATTLKEQAAVAAEAERAAVADDPLVKEVLLTFPGSTLTVIAAEPEAVPASEGATPLPVAAEPLRTDGDEIGYVEDTTTDDDL